MARRKNKLFKTTSVMHAETVADLDWSSFAVLEKQQDMFNSAYIEKVRISYVAYEEEDEVNYGFLFVASLDSALDSSTPGNNDGQIIASGTGRGGAATTTLDIKRSIRSNVSDNADAAITALQQVTAGSPIYLHVHSSKLGEQTKILMTVEVFGRWHKCTAL